MSWPWSASHVPRRRGRGSRGSAASARIAEQSRHDRDARCRPRHGRRSDALDRCRAPSSRRRVRLGRRRCGPCALLGERLGRERRERPARGEVVRPGDVDRVVALVHAGRLEVVRDVPEVGVAEQAARARPRRSGRRRRARDGRSASRAPDRESLRWTISSRSRPIARRSGRRHRRPRRRCRSRSPRPRRAPCRGRSRAARGRSPAAAIASAISASSSTVVPSPNAAAGRVLEHERRVAPLVAGERGTATRPSATRAAPASTPAPRCEPTWTLTYAAPYDPGAPASSCARTSTDARETSAPGPARLTRYGGVDRHRADVEVGEAVAERRLLARRVAGAGARPSGCRRRPGSRSRRSRRPGRRP